MLLIPAINFSPVNDTGQQLSPVTTTSAINLSQVTTTPVVSLTPVNSLLAVSLTPAITFFLGVVVTAQK